MKAVVIAAALAALFLTAPARAEDALTRSDVEAIIKETLSKNPEIIVSALKEYQDKQRAEQGEKSRKAVQERAKELQNDKSSPMAGNPKGDVTVVEFFDYHCGYCKKMLPAVTELIKSDAKLKVVFKELPILSRDSELAAKAALAVFYLKPEKYFAFHSALMDSTGKFDEAKLLSTAKELGVAPDKLKTEMDGDRVKTELKKTRDLADAMNIRGTPAFVVGDTLISGAASVEDMQKAIADFRKGKKK